MAGEVKSKKKVVIKKVIRKKKTNNEKGVGKSSEGAVEPTAAAAYVSPAAAAGDVPEDDGRGPTLEESMDQEAQASAEADAALLSKTLQPAKADDTLEDTQVDADPKSQVIDVDSQPSKLESDLQKFMDDYVEDRQRLPEEETQPYEMNEPDGETHDGDAQKANAGVEVADASLPHEDHDEEQVGWNTCQGDNSSGRYWSNYDWGWDGSWKNYWGDYSYYGHHSWNWNYDDDASYQSRHGFTRSPSMESGVSRLTGLTSVSQLDRSLKRLNTPDLASQVEQDKIRDDQEPQEKRTDVARDSADKNPGHDGKPGKPDDVQQGSVDAERGDGGNGDGKGGEETNTVNGNEGHHGSDATAPSSANGDKARNFTICHIYQKRIVFHINIHVTSICVLCDTRDHVS